MADAAKTRGPVLVGAFVLAWAWMSLGTLGLGLAGWLARGPLLAWTVAGPILVFLVTRPRPGAGEGKSIG